MNYSNLKSSILPLVLGNGAIILLALLGTKVALGTYAPQPWLPVYCLLFGYCLTMQFLFTRWKIQPAAAYNVVFLALYLGVDQQNQLLTASTLSFVLASVMGFQVGRWIRGTAWKPYFVGCAGVQITALLHILNYSELVEPRSFFVCMVVGLLPLAATIIFVFSRDADFDASLLKTGGEM